MQSSGKLALALATVGLGVLAAGPLRGGHTADGEYKLLYDGAPLDQDQTDAVQGAIDDLEEGGMEEQAADLQGMLDEGRICVETGWSNDYAAASTLTDGVPDPCGDRMNVNPSYLGGHPEILKCLMLHEAIHVGQSGDGGGAKESEKIAYGVQWECLCNAMDTAGVQGEKDSTYAKLESLCQEDGGGGEESASAVPTSGFHQVIVGNTGALILQGQQSIRTWALTGGPSATFFMSSVYNPFTVEAMPGRSPSGGYVVAVAGLDAFGDGVVQYLDVHASAGTVTASRGSVALPGHTPFSLVAQSGTTNELWFLDPVADTIRRIVDTDSDGLPDALHALPWANAFIHPELSSALALETRSTNSVFALPVDMRWRAILPRDTPVDAFEDTDADGIAEASENWLFGELPLVHPTATRLSYGETDVRLIGRSLAPVELWESDATGTLVQLAGTATLDSTGRGSIALAAGPSIGDWYLLRDTSGIVPSMPKSFQVQPRKMYGDSCPTGTGYDPIGWVRPEMQVNGSTVGGLSIGSTSRWTLEMGSIGEVAVLGLSLSQTNIPLAPLGAPGCTLYAYPFVTTFAVATDSTGGATRAVPIPNDSSLIGLDLYGQWFVVDRSNAYGAVTSNGMALQIQP